MDNPKDKVEKWDKRYSSEEIALDRPLAVQVLRDHLYLLPKKGCALDLACGLGANALLLAEAGLEAYAWDFSSVAIDKLNQQARLKGVSITTELRDVVDSPPQANSFDVVVVSRFLERSVFPHIIAALRENGLLFYQTFIRDKDPSVGPNTTDFLLGRNELLHLCQGLQVVYYSEEGRLGDCYKGIRNEAAIIAQYWNE